MRLQNSCTAKVNNDFKSQQGLVCVNADRINSKFKCSIYRQIRTA